MIPFLTALWERWNQIPAPLPTAEAPIAPPALKQEQFADLQAEAQRRQQAEHHLHLRVIVGNNRNVTRNYGHGDVDETLRCRHAYEVGGGALTDREIEAAAAVGMELKVTDAKIVDLRNAKSFEKLREETIARRFAERAP